MKLAIPGHCFSLKNHRPIFRGKAGRPFIGKSKKYQDYERRARACLRVAWDDRPALTGRVRISVRCYYAGPEPDATAPLETVFDLLQAAGVVKNDRQLVPWGQPAVRRIHVKRAEERVEIELVEEAEDW